MKRLLPLFFLMLVIGCKQKEKSNAGTADNAFQQLSDSIIDSYLNWRPVQGMVLGLHQFDGKLPDLSKASIQQELSRLKDFDQRLATIDTSALSQQPFLDYRILKLAIKDEIFDIEDLHEYSDNPMTYLELLDVNNYIKKNYAPLEERLKYVIEIQQKSSSVLETAKTNLDDSIARPFIQTSIQIAEGAIQFMKGDLVVALKDVKNDSLMKQFHASNDSLVGTIRNFISWLKTEKLPKAVDRYAIGRENYRKMLLYGEDIDQTPEEILAIGLAALKKEQAAFAAAAKVIDPAKKPIDVFHEVQKEHPAADSLIPEAIKHLEMIRQYVIDHHINTIPSEARIKVEETPQYARSTSTASMDSPGPFEQKATEAYYYITPVDPAWTARQKEDWLAQFDYYSTDNVSIHEAYPGHYVQGLHLNASNATRIEKIFGSYAFVEGWAHYCEEMMIEEGWGNTGDPVKAAKYKITQSADALLRICRLCVSIKMHCQGMTIEEGTKFLMDNWYQGEKPSYQEALRGSFDPGFLFYTVGKFQILKLRRDYQQQEGAAYSLQKFNDAVLDHGQPQIRLLREILLKDKKTWNEDF